MKDFPPDRRLQAWIAVVVVVQLTLLGAVVAGLVWLTVHAGVVPLIFVGALLLIGAVAAPRREDRGGRRPTDADAQRVRPLLERLAVQADVAAPALTVERADAPLSWTSAVPWKANRVHVTTGLLDRLDDPALEAVLAHELGHILNRDALVMSVLGGPPILVLRGLVAAVKEEIRAVVLLVLVGPFAAVLAITGRVLSRRRELAADRVAAVLTGSPARVQAALLAVGDGLAQIPSQDLRAVAPRDPFHFVPARPARHVTRLWATHPPIAARVERLAAMEARLQGKSAFTRS